MLLVVLVATAARLWLAVDRPLWFDEIFTIWASRPPLARLLSILANDSGPPLFYLLEMAFVAVGERILSSDAVARALPWGATAALLLGALFLPTSPARRRFALLASVSPLLTAYSAEARAYALLGLLVFLLYLVAIVLPESRRGLAAAFLLSAASLYTHYLALFAVAALVAVAAARKRGRPAVAAASGSIAYLPWIPVMLRQPEEAVSWMHEPPAAFLAGILSALGGAGRIPAPFAPPLPPALVGIGAAVGLGLVIFLARSWHDDPRAASGLAFIVLFFALVTLASLVRPVGFAGRTEMAVLPVWLWTVASSGDGRRSIRTLTAAAIAVGAAASALVLVAPKSPSLPLHALARLETVARPGDALFAGAHFYLPARLSADRGTLKSELHAFPADQAEHPGWTSPSAPAASDLAAVEGVLDRSAPDARVFLQLPPYAAAALEPLLAGRGVLRRVAASPEMVLYVWRPG